MTLESPVRLYAADHPRLAANLFARLKRDRQLLIEDIGIGCCKDDADYRYLTGIVEGFRRALVLCDQIEKELNQR